MRPWGLDINLEAENLEIEKKSQVAFDDLNRIGLAFDEISFPSYVKEENNESSQMLATTNDNLSHWLGFDSLLDPIQPQQRQNKYLFK